MKMIEKIVQQIEEELNGAEMYAKCAIKHKDEDMMMAKMYYDMSLDEMKHVNMLHEESVKLINDYKAKGNEIPEAMQSVYDFLHERHIEHAKDVRMYQNLYKNQG